MDINKKESQSHIGSNMYKFRIIFKAYLWQLNIYNLLWKDESQKRQLPSS